MRGFVNLLKPSGMTSSDAVVKVRGILREATGVKHKVGHLGTLDPSGAGVLPIAIGTATRLFDYSTKKLKRYIAGFKFGITTDTLDSYGVITGRSENLPSYEQILEVIPSLIGEIDQIPPQFSALSVGGVKAYKMARQMIEVELESRKINIYSIKLIDSIEDGHFIFDICCEGGTYIRSVARDMAFALNTVGYMSFIIRLQSGEFNIENSVTFGDFSKEPLKYVTPIEKFTKNLPRFDIPEEYAAKVLNGVRLELNSPECDFAAYISGELIGIGGTTDKKLTIKTRL